MSKNNNQLVFRRKNGNTRRIERTVEEPVSEPVTVNSQGSSQVSDIVNLPSGVIHSTFNYKLFRPHHLNREINPNNLNKIKNELKKNNLLYVNPIVVDRAGQIYDGGHRFQAAMDLGLEVFFTISDDLDAKDIASLNTATKPWRIEDFLEYHCNRGVQSYIDFREIYNAMMPGKKKGMTQAFLLGCSVCSSNGKEKGGVNAFKEGKFTFDKRAHLLRVLHHAKEFEFIHDKWSSSSFLRAIGLMFKTKGYDPKRMIHNSRQRANHFQPVTSAGAYLDILEKIYNFRRSEENHIRFVRR